MRDRHRGRFGACALLLLLFLGLATVAAAEESFDQALERATRLSVSASWQQTQEVLDSLHPRLAQASDRQRGDFLLLQARNLALSGKLDDALHMIDEMISLPLTRAQAIRAHGLGANVAMLARRYDRSFELLGKGLALEPDLDDLDGLVGMLSVASYIHAQAGQPARAIDYGMRSVEFAERSGSTRDRCLTTLRLAFAYKMVPDFERAETRYRQAIELCEQAGDPVFRGAARSGLGDLLRQQERLDEAEVMLEQALAGLEEAGFQVGLAEARYYQARLLLAQGHLERAQESLSGLTDLFRASTHWDYLSESYRMLAEIARRQGDMPSAADYLAEALSSREKHVDRERALHLAFLGVEFDLQFKEQELALLREQARAAQLQEEGQRQRTRLHLLGATVAALLALVLALLLMHARSERRRLLSLSRSDALTGLNNHTAFLEIASQELRSAQRDGRALTLVLADIDFFKQVNDRYGHPAGDQVLRRVTELLHLSFDEHGSLGRLGGEEFGICLPSMSGEEAMLHLQRFRHCMAAARPGPGNSILTMSFGAAEMHAEESFEALRERADQALYAAKHSGRDRVRLSDDRAAAPVPALPA